jgi:signal transduction histidine kinase
MNMMDRVAAVAGTLTIDSAVGAGTRVRVEVPGT